MKSLYLPQWKAFIRYYDISAEGNVVVYLPALSFPAIANFLPVATHPKMPRHRALLIDNLGSGFSDHAGSFNYTMEEHAKTVAAILDHENIKAATVVGHSMGGTIAILLALSRPDLVAKLVVGEGNITPGGGAGTRRIAAYSKEEYVGEVFPRTRAGLIESAVAGDEMATRLSGLWATVYPDGLYGNAKSLVELDPLLKNRFLNLTIPRTFIYGENSLPGGAVKVSPDAPDPGELKAHGVEVGVVPKAGHSQMFENLDGFVDVLIKALT
tara:strand:+ start:93 stop:899 length:807 start_codon:yes stop_codon:yes gene_type:complete